MAKASNILPFHKDEASNGQSNGKEHYNGNGTNHNNNNGSRGSRFKVAVTARWKNELVAAAAEFAGTFMFLFFAFGGTQVANSGAEANEQVEVGQERNDNSIARIPVTIVLLYISLVFGFSLMVNVWVFFRVSGGLFNPAVTLGLYLIGAIKATRAIMCFISQMLAGMCAAAVVKAILPGQLNVSTTLGPGMTPARGVFLEMFLTSILVFTIFMLAAEKHKSTFLAPVGIGLSLFIAELMGVPFTGGSLNPARSFGPCVVIKEFPGYHYIYWFGPLMGTMLAWGMYTIVKSVEYETVNPGQDFDDHEAALFHPPEVPSSPDEVGRPNVAAITAERAVRLVRESSHGTHGPSIDQDKFMGKDRDEDGHMESVSNRGRRPSRKSDRARELERLGHASRL